MATFFPAIDSWYQEQATGRLFEVVAVDEKYGTIEVQYEDGDIAEFDLESWGHLEITMATAPESGSAIFGDASFDSEISSNYYGNPLEEIEPDSFSGFDDLL